MNPVDVGYTVLAVAVLEQAFHDLKGRDVLQAVDALVWLAASGDFYAEGLGYGGDIPILVEWLKVTYGKQSNPTPTRSLCRADERPGALPDAVTSAR